MNSPQAEDLTQEFFARLLAGNSFAGVSPDKGRFRTFLVTARMKAEYEAAGQSER